MSEVIIVPVRGHYEAYRNGEFVCSGDTEAECEKESEE